MKNLCAKLLVIAALGVVIAMTGCFFHHTDLVINEKVCVNFDESFTTGTFSTFVVCDKFRQILVNKLAEDGLTMDDVKSIHMVSGTFKTMAVTGNNHHDWWITADVDISRQDDPNGPVMDGPASFVSFNHQSLKALKGKPTDADLNADGVELVDRALESLVDGEDPRLILTVNNESVSPDPSDSDPMEFKLLTCVRFQAIVHMK